MFRLSLLFTSLLAASIVSADTTIVSQTGTNSSQIGTLTYASWTQTSPFSGVSIAAVLRSAGGTGTGTAYLTTQIGPGTTTAQEVATAPISITNTTPTLTTIFSGLALNAGTYYLVINPTPPPGQLTSALQWEFGSGVTVTTAIGVTANNGASVQGTAASYPPASPFGQNQGTTLLYTVTGTPGATTPVLPLPPSVILSLTGLAAVGVYEGRRRWAARFRSDARREN